jgi:aspartate kinase
MHEAGKGHRPRGPSDTAPMPRSRILVQKFGGTSVASLDHIARCAKRVIAAHDAGFAVVVVVSAMSGETDRLLSMAHRMTVTPAPRELDVLVATGEQITSALTAMTIAFLGRKARSFQGHQVRITTDSIHSDARIRHVDRDRILNVLATGEIAVLAGFQGVDPNGSITTLGRGGSDTTAVALAAALHATACEIYTDVDGVYTADPAVCSTARRLLRVSYRQMLAFSSLGAKVLNHRSVALGMKYKTPIHVRTSFSSEPGTWVMDDDDETHAGTAVTGIAQDRDLAHIRLIAQDPQEHTEIMVALAEHKIKLDRVAPAEPRGPSSRPTTAFLVRKADADRALGVIEARKRESTRVETDQGVARVSVVGASLNRNRTLTTCILRWLDELRIPVRSLSRTETSISCLIDAAHGADAVCALHDALGLSATSEGSACITPGQPGSARAAPSVLDAALSASPIPAGALVRGSSAHR